MILDLASDSALIGMKVANESRAMLESVNLAVSIHSFHFGNILEFPYRLLPDGKAHTHPTLPHHRVAYSNTISMYCIAPNKKTRQTMRLDRRIFFFFLPQAQSTGAPAGVVPRVADRLPD